MLAYVPMYTSDADFKKKLKLIKRLYEDLISDGFSNVPGNSITSAVRSALS